MGIIGSIALRMSANPAPLKKDLRNAALSVQGFRDQVVSTASIVRGAFAAAVGGAGALAIGKMIKGSSDLAESVGKIGAIFGPQGAAVERDARAMADAFGVSLNGMLDGAGKLGGLFKGAGFDADATAGLSEQFNHLALDASRFFNVPYDVAFNKIRSGLSGEAEPLRDFGVNLTAAKVEAEALALGLADAGGAMSDQAKMAASASLIAKGLADAQGNAAATAGGTAAQIESLSGRFENLMTTLGDGLAPVAGRVLGGINTAIAAMTEMWNASKDSVMGFASSALESLGLAGEGFNVIEAAIGGIATAWQSVTLAFKASRLVFQEVFAALFSGVAEVARVFDSAADAVFGASSGLGERLGVMNESLRDTLAEGRKAFADEMARPWAWKSVGEQFEAVRKRMRDAQSEGAKGPDAIASLIGKKASSPDVGAAASASAGKSDRVLGAALRLGSTEAASAVLRSRFGGDRSGDATAKNTHDTAAAVKESILVQRQILKSLTPAARVAKLVGI